MIQCRLSPILDKPDIYGLKSKRKKKKKKAVIKLSRNVEESTAKGSDQSNKRNSSFPFF